MNNPMVTSSSMTAVFSKLDSIHHELNACRTELVGGILSSLRKRDEVSSARCVRCGAASSTEESLAETRPMIKRQRQAGDEASAAQGDAGAIQPSPWAAIEGKEHEHPVVEQQEATKRARADNRRAASALDEESGSSSAEMTAAVKHLSTSINAAAADNGPGALDFAMARLKSADRRREAAERAQKVAQDLLKQANDELDDAIREANDARLSVQSVRDRSVGAKSTGHKGVIEQRTESKETQMTDLTLESLKLFLWSHFLPVDEALYLAAVSKSWRACVDAEKERLADWPAMVNFLNRVNGFHICSECFERNVDCTCWDGYDEYLEKDDAGLEISDEERDKYELLQPINEEDPRNSKDVPFASLAPHIQAEKLFAFHRCCIANFSKKLDPVDLTSTVSYGVFLSVYSRYDFDRLLCALEAHDLPAFHALVRTADIKLAEKELASDRITSCISNFREAFAPNSWSHYDREFYESDIRPAVGEILNQREPLPGEEIVGCNQKYECPHTKSQVENVRATLIKVLLQRCEEADRLFGTDLADSINIMRKARETTLPKLLAQPTNSYLGLP